MKPDGLAQLACMALLGRAATTVRLLSQNGSPGTSPVLWVELAGGPYVVVKLYGGHRQVRAYRHAEVATAVSAHTAVATAAVVACGVLPGTDVTALIIADLGVLELNLAIHSGILPREHALAAMGRLWSQLHGLPSDALDTRYGQGPRIEADRLVAYRRDVVDSAALAVVVRAAEAARPRTGRVWCHGDLHPGNVLVEQPTGRLTVADLEDMVQAVPEYDLAQCLAASDAPCRTTTSRSL